MIATLTGLLLTGLVQASSPPPEPPPPSRASPARWLGGPVRFAKGDYPAEARRNREEGVVGYRLEIGADGRVTRCRVTSPSGSASLDAATCRLLTKRARFTPARDSNGRPAPGAVWSRIAWRLDSSRPHERLTRIEPFERAMEVRGTEITPAGESRCWKSDDGGPRSPEPCGDRFGDLEEVALREGKPLTILFVVTKTPEGEEEMSLPGDHGRMWHEWEAVLTIDADGGQTECLVLRNGASPFRPDGPYPPRPGGADAADLPDLCAATATHRFEPAAEGAPPRRVRMKARAYFRL
jgi:TonB family protein